MPLPNSCQLGPGSVMRMFPSRVVQASEQVCHASSVFVYRILQGDKESSLEKPQKSLPGKITTFLPGRTHLKATKGVSSVCEPLPPDRPLWFPGSTPPEWLDGSLPGDFGFDPLGLGSDPESLKWFAQAELMHARWAMLAVAGILIPELLERLGFIENFSWYDAGSREYFADSTTLFVVQMALMGWVEGRRWADIIKPGSVDIQLKLPNKKNPTPDVGYPGGLWFDPLMWGRGSPEPVMVLRTKEIKNGRLAMLAFVGFVFQAIYTGEGPIENLMAHLADPGHCNIFSPCHLHHSIPPLKATYSYQHGTPPSCQPRIKQKETEQPKQRLRQPQDLSEQRLLSIRSFTISDTLIKLKKSFTQGDLNSWVPGSSPCLKKWIGVMCSGETIIGLHLTGLRLSGSVDVQALLQLRGLRTISLVKNSFTGPIPEFNKLGALRAIYLSNNQFSGEIPNDYFTSMGSLKKIWLNENKFTGNIPESLMQLPHLAELHIEDNQFSGTIPSLKYPKVVTSINLSRNNLEGEIPESFSNFNASIFEGNVGLCGKPLETDCDKVQEPGASNPTGENQGSHPNAKVLITITTLVMILFFVIVSINSAKRRRDNDFSVLSREPLKEEVLQVRVPESPLRKPSESSSRKSSSESKRGSSQHKNGMTDLVMVNDEKGAFGLQDLMKAAAEVLGNGGLGSAYKAVMANGLSVVVKRMREMNRLGKDGFDAEMKRFGSIRHPNILTPLAYHFRREEKLIVSEYMPKGSLLYVLHGDRGIIHSYLNWPTRLKIIQGIARGLSFIHTEFARLEVPHGNLKSSNVLLTENYDPLLSDFAFQPLTNSSGAAQGLFAYKSPEYLQCQQVSPKSDVYCLGILILEIITGKFPSQYLSNGKGGTDIVQWVQTSMSENKVEELIDPEIANNTVSINQMTQLLQIGAACTESNPDQRLHMKETINRIEEIK
ncbi:hypothetical protein DITRI_Ditri10aG0094400 [Diplodiscus trichospermus]